MATAGRVAGGRRLGAAARAVARALTCGRRDRVVARSRGLQPRAGEQGGSATGPSPVDRARNGSKHHLWVDATGIPLAWTLTGGNRNDVTQLIPLVERVPPVRGKVGRPRRRPERVTADRGYDHDKYRRQLRQRGIKPEIARRQTGHGSGLGRARWVVERTFAWLHQHKRLLRMACRGLVGNATARLGVGDPLEPPSGSCRGTGLGHAPRVAACPAAWPDFSGLLQRQRARGRRRTCRRSSCREDGE